ncbi:fluoride efflux transporter CrcB [Ralstonia mannitolilytica]|jgi:CrcB protein|uniref:Fluoride-specific ion channel FluC n=1 Tax=Ralstonia mannitolilytica TaxID=105219 RepID=A0AAD2AS86_9RALS|nr:fluoride efflux transporter CrcB [Ralstonia mannitolilytica]ATG20079.1 fluoride efflux transporter CrcB [Ralstonia pickettii]AJW45149.1 camphor resistance protein CrcB [Ralstonia mannitolilytica]ANA34674.1 camphor resistance protein CrcB [Ralstonia mannitolilytica]MBU9579118.1 fluoride efflux transporter CrcB [Ralstonia mannitolilytica]MBY4719199.1 fluoride efflux transporter CrcB [Ralstonia mannitolilytica]
MSGMGFVAVGVGAALGAWLRWLFAVLWNAINPALPYGTLAANLLGGYLIGVAVGFFDTHAGLPPEWRLLAVTGFLGGLTTFSTFSSEVVANILAGDYVVGALHVAVHLGGSLFLTLLGLWTVRTFS